MAPSGGSEGEYALYVSGHMFQAMVTRLHSPRGRASKRRWSCSIRLFKGQVAGNLEFLQACECNMPKGKRIVAVRADSAAYQAALFNWCEVTGKLFAIGADQDAAVKVAITGIPESDWKTFRDGEIAETIHCMNKTDKAFRLIVLVQH